jgi:hypothetical protein
MSSYIFVNKSRAALKERVEALEVELANLKDHLTSDKEEEEGTARIEQFDSEDLFFEQQKEDKLKKSIETDLKKAIESEVAKVKFHFETKIRDNLMTEQEVLFLKMRDELAIKIKKYVDKTHSNVTAEMKKYVEKETTKQQHDMFFRLLANYKVNVCTRATQVEEGELPVQSLADTEDFHDIKMSTDNMSDASDESLNLLT